MKKRMLFIFILILSVVLLSNSIAAGFKDDYDAIEEATKSVLKIYVYESIDDDVLDYASTGSGFVAFNSSTMITNYHMIDDAAMVVALDDDDNVYEIDKVLCADQEADIAILKFTVPSSLKPLELYPDNQLKRGAPVVAIGSPKGLKNTVSTGIVSYAYDDGIPEIQITAPISPGSSGGALFNDNGKVIGVTSSGYQSKDEYGENTDAQNINFAVNIAVAQAMYNAWDGSTYPFTSFPSTAKMDFTDVYKHEPDETTQPSDQPVIIEAESSGTWICINCGAENTTKFCQECGAEKPVWICSCGKINSSNKFCGECGKSYAELIAAFDEAVEKAKQLDYEGAVEILEDLGSFNSGSFETAAGTHADAQSYVDKTYYDQGLYLQENGGDHDAILKSFEKAGTYGDAQEQIAGENARFAKLNYDAGIEQLNKGEYLSAIDSFKAAGEFQDAAEKILEVYYAWGQNLLENKNYEESREKFILAGEYENASDMVYGTYYVEAEECLKNLDYENALSLFEKAGDYLDAKEKIAEIENSKKEKTYQSAMTAYESQDYTLAKELFAGISGYKDADELALNAELLNIQILLDQNYPNDDISGYDKKELTKYVEVLINHKDDNELASELYKRVYYLHGLSSLANEYYMEAMTLFKSAIGYKDTAEQQHKAKIGIVERYLNNGEYERAADYYIKEFVPHGYEAPYTIMDVNSTGRIVSEVLNLVKALQPNNTKIPKDENVYKESYEPLIIKMEEHFGFVNDGKISMEEYYEIHNMIYLGSKGIRVLSLLEKLADLGYFQKLPESHDSYENRYVAGIKKAEKTLGLQEDGIVTKAEYETIMEQIVSAPEAPSKLNITVKNDTVNISWPKVEGAVFYEISVIGRNVNPRQESIKIDELINLVAERKVGKNTDKSASSEAIEEKVLGITDKTNWIDKNVVTGETRTYIVRAKKYTVTGPLKEESVDVPRYYMPITIEELKKNYSKYEGTYVEIKNAPFDDWTIEFGDAGTFGKKTRSKGLGTVVTAQRENGYDLLILCRNSEDSVEFVLEDYYRWGWNDYFTDPAMLCYKMKMASVSGKGLVQKRTNRWLEGKEIGKNQYTFDVHIKYSEVPSVLLEEVKYREKN